MVAFLVAALCLASQQALAFSPLASSSLLVPPSSSPLAGPAALARSRTLSSPVVSARPSFENPRQFFSSVVLSAASTSPTDSEKKCHIQILMSDTGGGHRASANALRDAFDILHPNQIECDIVDLYTDYGPFWPYNAYVPLYKIMAEYSFLWDAFYHFGCTPFGLWLNEFMLELFCYEPFKKCLDRPSGSSKKRADMVVSVHPLCQDIPLKILTDLDTDGKSRKVGRTTPFVTVVTDLGGAHPTWFNPGVDRCFVPSDALHDAALKRGVTEDQIVQHGLPIRRGFWSDVSTERAAGSKSGGSQSWFAQTFGMANPTKKDKKKMDNKSELRKDLNLMQNVPTVLIVGGGDGMGGIVQQALAVADKLDADAAAAAEALTSASPSSAETSPAFQMIVVCGNNQKAQDQLSSHSFGPNIHVSVQGFVNNMDEYMRASDCLVTKAGPGTIAEASICGLPCLLSSYLPGQEAGNVPYVKENGFGTYQGNPRGIANTVATWLEDEEILGTMKEKALQAARPGATIDIARDLADLVFETKKKMK